MGDPGSAVFFYSTDRRVNFSFIIISLNIIFVYKKLSHYETWTQNLRLVHNPYHWATETMLMYVLFEQDYKEEPEINIQKKNGIPFNRTVEDMLPWQLYH
jgi:hypothetical protein